MSTKIHYIKTLLHCQIQTSSGPKKELLLQKKVYSCFVTKIERKSNKKAINFPTIYSHNCLYKTSFCFLIPFKLSKKSKNMHKMLKNQVQVLLFHAQSIACTFLHGPCMYYLFMLRKKGNKTSFFNRQIWCDAICNLKGMHNSYALSQVQFQQNSRWASMSFFALFYSTVFCMNS